jgi:predicted GNAT family acetyltransferase
MADLVVTRDDEARRYVGHLGDLEEVAVLEFRPRPGTDPHVLTLTHTEVPRSMRGEGVGGRLVAEALADVRRRGELIVPSCPFVASWLGEHPEHLDLVER